MDVITLDIYLYISRVLAIYKSCIMICKARKLTSTFKMLFQMKNLTYTMSLYVFVFTNMTNNQIH